MPIPNPTPLAENRAAAKRQAVTTVSIVALILILWPERFIILRNLCLVPVVAWVTALVFDLKHGALDAWDGVPAWLKRIIGADDNSSGSGINNSRRNEPSYMRNRQHASSTKMSDFVLTHLGDSVSLVMREAVRLWELARPILAEWARQAIQWLSSQASTSQTSSSASFKKPSPKFTQYYGILVKSPRGPDVPPAFAPLFQMRDVPGSFDSRESKHASAVPSVLSSWDAECRLSLVLVEKTVWDDGHLTLRRKLSTGTNWSLSPPGRGKFDKPMPSEKPEFGQIRGVDVVGLGDGQYDALTKCRQCFQLLSQDWKYTRMLWDDVDFAVILSLLVLGPAAGSKCVELYRSLCQLREKQAGGATRGAAGLSPLLVAAATGGLAAPFALPLMAAAAAAAAMKKGGRNGMQEQRKAAYRSLTIQFPELKVLFEEEEGGQREKEEEWKEEEEDYCNEAFSPFDW